MEDYLTEVPYTWGYFSDQSPVRLSFVAALHGLKPPDFHEGFTWLELGCGNGLTAAVLADSHPQGRFWGVDINPAHIRNARRLVERGQLRNLEFFQGGFRDFMRENSALSFDFITLHGVYSWVGPEVRAEIRALIRSMLNPGGVLYISYNALPGCAERVPLRQLLVDTANRTKGTKLEKARAAIRLVQALTNVDAPFFRENARLASYTRRLNDEPISYIAHEFLNTHWRPFAFSEMAEQMADINLYFCGSTCLPNNDESLRVPTNLMTFLPSTDQRSLREEWISVLLNETFRFDVFARKPRNENPELLLSPFVPASLRLKGTINSSAKAGLVTLSFRGNLFEQLGKAAAHGPLPFGRLVQLPTLNGFSITDTARALFLLTAAKQLEIMAIPALPLSGRIREGFRLTSALNRELLSWRLPVDRQAYLATRVRGCGLYIGLRDGFLLLAGDGKPLHNWLTRAKDLVSQYNIDVNLDQRVDRFLETTLPMLEAYGVVEATT